MASITINLLPHVIELIKSNVEEPNNVRIKAVKIPIENELIIEFSYMKTHFIVIHTHNNENKCIFESYESYEFIFNLDEKTTLFKLIKDKVIRKRIDDSIKAEE
jgi:hypothetical protein